MKLLSDRDLISQKDLLEIAETIAGYPYTTACSPKKMILDGDEHRIRFFNLNI